MLPGDIVTSMNGLPVGTDGTFKDYCDVIRTAGEGAPINVEVLRFDTSEVLRGEINGDQPIELAFSFAEEVGDEVGDDSGAVPEVDLRVRDRRHRAIYMDVPTAWSERDTAPGTMDDGTVVPYIAAATNLDGFRSGLDGSRHVLRQAADDGHRCGAGPVRLRRRLHRRRDHRLLRCRVHRQVPGVAGLRRHDHRRRHARRPAGRRLATPR